MRFDANLTQIEKKQEKWLVVRNVTQSEMELCNKGGCFC